MLFCLANARLRTLWFGCHFPWGCANTKTCCWKLASFQVNFNCFTRLSDFLTAPPPQCLMLEDKCDTMQFRNQWCDWPNKNHENYMDLSSDLAFHLKAACHIVNQWDLTGLLIRFLFQNVIKRRLSFTTWNETPSRSAHTHCYNCIKGFA